MPFPLHGLARHKASSLSPPSRRTWVVVTLLVALTALPTLVVVLAGRAALDSSAPRPPSRADAPPLVVIDPGQPVEPAQQPSEAAAAHFTANPARSAPQGVPERTAPADGAAHDRVESRPCPPSAGPKPPEPTDPGTAGARPSEEPDDDVPGEEFLDRVWDELGLSG